MSAKEKLCTHCGTEPYLYLEIPFLYSANFGKEIKKQTTVSYASILFYGLLQQ